MSSTTPEPIVYAYQSETARRIYQSLYPDRSFDDAGPNAIQAFHLASLKAEEWLLSCFKSEAKLAIDGVYSLDALVRE